MYTPNKRPRSTTIDDDNDGQQRRKCNDAPFPEKIHDMINYCEKHKEYAKVAGWTTDGTMFVIKDIQRFASDIIPKYFVHNKFTSLQRQLNMYGFRKQKQTESKQNRATFSHAIFHRDITKELLETILRSTTNASNKQKQRVGDFANENAALKAKLAAVEADFEFLKEQYAATNADFEFLKEQLAATNARVTAIEMLRSGQKSSVAGVSTSLNETHHIGPVPLVSEESTCPWKDIGQTSPQELDGPFVSVTNSDRQSSVTGVSPSLNKTRHVENNSDNNDRLAVIERMCRQITKELKRQPDSVKNSTFHGTNQDGQKKLRPHMIAHHGPSCGDYHFTNLVNSPFSPARLGKLKCGPWRAYSSV